MARRVYLYIGKTYFGFTQKADINEEVGSADPVKTFDGPIPSLESEDNPVEVSFDLVQYEKNLENFISNEQLIRSTRTTPQAISIVEMVKFKDGTTAKITQRIDKCKLSSNKVAFDVENYTISSLSFKGTALRKFANGEEY